MKFIHSSDESECSICDLMHHKLSTVHRSLLLITFIVALTCNFSTCSSSDQVLDREADCEEILQYLLVVDSSRFEHVLQDVLSEPDACKQLYVHHPNGSDYFVEDIDLNELNDFGLVISNGPFQELLLGMFYSDTTVIRRYRLGIVNDCLNLEARPGRLIVNYPDPEESVVYTEKNKWIYNFRSDTFIVRERMLVDEKHYTPIRNNVNSIKIVIEDTWRIQSDTVMISIAENKIMTSQYILQDESYHNETKQLKADDPMIKKLVFLVTHLDTTDLRKSYSAQWTDDATMHTGINYSDGGQFTITDYGSVSTEIMRGIYGMIYTILEENNKNYSPNIAPSSSRR